MARAQVVRLLTRKPTHATGRQISRRDQLLEVVEVFRIDIIGNHFEGIPSRVTFHFKEVTADAPMVVDYPLELPEPILHGQIDLLFWGNLVYTSIFEGNQYSMRLLQQYYAEDTDLGDQLRFLTIQELSATGLEWRDFFTHVNLLDLNAQVGQNSIEEISAIEITMKVIKELYPEHYLKASLICYDLVALMRYYASILPHPTGPARQWGTMDPTACPSN